MKYSPDGFGRLGGICSFTINRVTLPWLLAGLAGLERGLAILCFRWQQFVQQVHSQWKSLNLPVPIPVFCDNCYNWQECMVTLLWNLFCRANPAFNKEVFVDFIAAQIKTLSFLAYIIRIYQVWPGLYFSKTLKGTFGLKPLISVLWLG